MFEAGQTPGSGCSDRSDAAADGPEKRQYTIKGIEAEAIELVRDAARRDGMKIGAWISSRMKEAAFRSLSAPQAISAQQGYEGQIQNREAEDTSSSEIAAALHALDRRLREIEDEMHQITKSQRTIMSRMLESA